MILETEEDTPNKQDGQEGDLMQSLLSDEEYYLHSYQINLGE